MSKTTVYRTKDPPFFHIFVNFLSVLNDIEILSWDVQGHFGA